MIDLKELLRLLEEEANMRASIIADGQFPRVAEVWLESRVPYLSPKTIHEYRLNLKTLSLYFHDRKASEITADDIRAYQKMRREKCGPFAINHECSVLQQILKRIGTWSAIEGHYQPLPLPKEKRGRALRDEQKTELIRIASSDPNWEAAYLFAVISVNTSAGPKECATLRHKDIDFERKILTVQPEGAKNVHRSRSIPLNDEALVALRRAIARAKGLGSTEPDHYIFPFRIHRALYDPTRYQTSFKTAWKRILAAANLPRFRMYDLRHTVTTNLLENPNVSEETVEAIVGHVSREMKKRYSHVRIESMRTAISALEGSRPQALPKAEPIPEKKPVRSVQNNPADILNALANLLKMCGVKAD